MKENKIRNLIFSCLCAASLCMVLLLTLNPLTLSADAATTGVSQTLAGTDVLSFFKANWLWFAIGAEVLIFVILTIVVVAVVKHKKKKVRKEAVSEKQKSEEVKTVSEEINSKVQQGSHEIKQESVKPVEPTSLQSSPQQNIVQPMYTMPQPEMFVSSLQPTYTKVSPVYVPPQPAAGDSTMQMVELIKLRMELDQQRKDFETWAKYQSQKDGNEIDVFANDRVKALQREYNDELRRIDEILHEQEKDKLREDLEKEHEIIDRLEEEYEMADELLEELNESLPRAQTVAIEPSFEVIEPPSTKKNRIIEEPDKSKKVSKDAVVIGEIKKQSLQEAYEALSLKQKEFFNQLRDYADKMPSSRIKETKTHISVGCGNKNYIRLTIKRGVTVAYFVSESEDMLKMRLNGEISLKPEEMQIKVVDEKTFEAAKKMIDLRIRQVNSELEMIKDMRNEKRRQEYVSKKKS